MATCLDQYEFSEFLPFSGENRSDEPVDVEARYPEYFETSRETKRETIDTKLDGKGFAYFDVKKARELMEKYDGINLSRVSREEQEAIIRDRYGDVVRKTPVSRMSDAQVYRVAKSIYDRSKLIVEKAGSR